MLLWVEKKLDHICTKKRANRLVLNIIDYRCKRMLGRKNKTKQNISSLSSEFNYGETLTELWLGWCSQLWRGASLFQETQSIQVINQDHSCCSAVSFGLSYPSDAQGQFRGCQGLTIPAKTLSGHSTPWSLSFTFMGKVWKTQEKYCET